MWGWFDRDREFGANGEGEEDEGIAFSGHFLVEGVRAWVLRRNVRKVKLLKGLDSCVCYLIEFIM